MSKNTAFTFIEISIVLVIIGLIAGSVFVGQSMLRQSHVMSIMADVQKYTKAANDFRDKYASLPGDFARATSFWPAGTCPPVNATPNTAKSTCNGNGDGKVDAATSREEEYLFWQHLANAGLIEGVFNGVPGSASVDSHVVGVNCPKGKFSGTCFGARYIATMNDNTGTHWFGTYNNSFVFGTTSGNTTPPWQPVLTPKEAYNIDVKSDDEIPSTGKIRTDKQAGNTSCNTTTVASTATYDLTNTNRVCSLVFITGL